MGRWGLGPVFASEWLTSTRRRQFYAARVLFVGLMLAALSCVWVSQVAGRRLATISELARVGQSFFGAIVFTQLIMVLVAAPASTAGVICQDKMRGNLVFLLVTDLSDAEVVLGKLAARLVSIVGMTCSRCRCSPWAHCSAASIRWPSWDRSWSRSAWRSSGVPLP